MAGNEEEKKKQIIRFHQFHSVLFNKCLLSTYWVHDKHLCLSLPSIADNYTVTWDLPSLSFPICGYVITIESCIILFFYIQIKAKQTFHLKGNP